MLAQLVAHMGQLRQRCTVKPLGLAEILRRNLRATIELAMRYACPCGAPCTGNHQKVLVEPLRIGLRVDALIQERQRQPATDVTRQRVFLCHRHAQASVVVLRYSAGGTQPFPIPLSLFLQLLFCSWIELMFGLVKIRRRPLQVMHWSLWLPIRLSLFPRSFSCRPVERVFGQARFPAMRCSLWPTMR